MLVFILTIGTAGHKASQSDHSPESTDAPVWRRKSLEVSTSRTRMIICMLLLGVPSVRSLLISCSVDLNPAADKVIP